MIMKKVFSIITVFAACLFTLAAQEIKTAPNYFADVSAVYGQIKSYEAEMDIKTKAQHMKANVSYKKPNLMRMDFSTPKDQTICFNGDLLTIYLPDNNAILTQNVDSGSAGGANMATSQGLSLLSRYYAVSYVTGPEPVPLEDGSDELVVKLEFKRKNLSESFRSIKISVSADTKLIRRIEAVTGTNETFSFDFTKYVLNNDIPNERFIYTAPSSANEYNNFLFSE